MFIVLYFILFICFYTDITSSPCRVLTRKICEFTAARLAEQSAGFNQERMRREPSRRPASWAVMFYSCVQGTPLTCSLTGQIQIPCHGHIHNNILFDFYWVFSPFFQNIGKISSGAVTICELREGNVRLCGFVKLCLKILTIGFKRPWNWKHPDQCRDRKIISGSAAWWSRVTATTLKCILSLY